MTQWYRGLTGTKPAYNLMLTILTCSEGRRNAKHTDSAHSNCYLCGRDLIELDLQLTKKDTPAITKYFPAVGS